MPGGAERHHDRTAAERAARLYQHRHVAGRVLEDDPGLAFERRAARVHEQELDALL